MQKYENINSLLERINNAIGVIKGFKWMSVYLFITTAVILSSSVTIGCIEAIGFEFAPVVYGSHIFYMLMFWLTVGMVLFVVMRNILIAGYITGKARGEYDQKRGVDKTFLALEKIENFACGLFTGKQWVCYFHTISAIVGSYAIISFMYIHKCELDVPVWLSCLFFISSIFYFALSRCHDGPSRNALLIFTYVLVITFSYVTGRAYVATVKRGNPDVIISILHPESEIRAKIFLATREGLVIFVDHKPQFHTWANLRKIVKLEPPFEGLAPQ